LLPSNVKLQPKLLFKQSSAPAFETQLFKLFTTDWFNGTETFALQFGPAKAAAGAAAISSNDSDNVVLTNLVFIILSSLSTLSKTLETLFLFGFASVKKYRPLYTQKSSHKNYQ